MDDNLSLEFNEKKDINNNKSEIDLKKNINNNEDKKPFFLMTLEDNMGNCQQIKIYQNSNPSELAYYFCKENNLDFTSMKYIKSNIKSIVKKFNEPQQKVLLYNKSNNSIKEEENEDDYLTEGTVKSNEKAKIQENKEEKNLNDNNLNEINLKNNYIDKNFNNENNNNEIQNNINYENENNLDDKDTNKDNKEQIHHLDKQNDFKEENKKDFYDIKNKIRNKDNSELKNIENVNSHIKIINNLVKMPLKINQISPKQIEINENIHKIINNNISKSENIIIDIDSQNNINFESHNEINKSNYNIMNTTDRSRKSCYISNFDKEIKEISCSTKSKENINLSDKKKNNSINSCQINEKTIDNNQIGEKEYEEESKKNNNFNNFDLIDFGKKYINLNKNIKEGKNNNSVDKDEISNSLVQSSESFENGVPVLNLENNNDKEKEKEQENNNYCGKIVNKNSSNIDKEKRTKFSQNINNDYNLNIMKNKTNKDFLLNKIKKTEINIPKKKAKKNSEINKLLKLIKNNCYNINKNINNKIIKDKNEILTFDKLKMKESNSLDINHEISRNLDNESNKNYSKELVNINNDIKNENKYKLNNCENSNFKNYIGNNKYNYKFKNNMSSSNNESNQNVSNTINKQYFFSNPNLSSNQEPINLSNAIYNIKYNTKNNTKKEVSNKSKSLGKDKNTKIKNISKNKIKLSKKKIMSINNKNKIKDLIKEKTKKYSLKFKKENNINNSSTQNSIDDKKKLNVKSCQTPPMKESTNAYHYINTLFSEWLMSTINKESRNIFTTRDQYFKKNKVINKTSKSISELIDNAGYKSKYDMLLSKSYFKNNKLNDNLKNIKYNRREKESKNINQNIINIKKKNHHYVNSLKLFNKSNTLYNNKFFSRKNNAENKNINNININKLTGRNKEIVKKQIEKLNYINLMNNNSLNTNTINDYNFNNNNSYLRKFINNTIHTFMYDSNENSKSEGKYKKIIQKQLTSPSKANYFERKTKKKSSDKIMGSKNGINKFRKIILNNSGSDQSYINDNCSNNININNLININNYQKNKNYNFNLNTNENNNNHYIKNSRLKKKKISNTLNKNINYENKKLINFSNELAKYYLNTEIYKNNYKKYNNLTYSNLIKNNLSLSNYESSTDDRLQDGFLISFFNKIFIILNKDKKKNCLIINSSCKKRLYYFSIKIRQILNIMIEILYKNLEKRRKNKLSNNSLLNTSKNCKDFEFKIDRNNFINEMIYIYKYYLCNENKKILLSYNDNLNRMEKDINTNDIIPPKSYQKMSKYKIKTKFGNIGKLKKE